MRFLVKISLVFGIFTTAQTVSAREKVVQLCGVILKGNVRLDCMATGLESPNPYADPKSIENFQMNLSLRKGYAAGPRELVTGRAMVSVKAGPKARPQRYDVLYQMDRDSMYMKLPDHFERAGDATIYLGLDSEGAVTSISYFQMTPWGRERILFVSAQQSTGLNGIKRFW